MTHKFKKAQVVEAFLDIKTWLLFGIALLLNVPNGGLIGFVSDLHGASDNQNSIIVNSLGYNVKETTLLAIPTGVISWVAALLVAFFARRTKKPLVCVGCSVLSESQQARTNAHP